MTLGTRYSLGLGRDGLVGGAAVALADGVFAQALGELLGMAHGLDPVGVHRLHFLDQAEDAVEFGLGGGKIAVGEFETGELGDVADFVGGKCHGNLQSCLNDKGL